MDNEAKLKIIIDPDYDVCFWDEGGCAFSNEDDISGDYIMTDEPVYLDTEGFTEWWHQFVRACDWVKGTLPPDFPIKEWHARGLELAGKLRKILPANIELWYTAPFEDKSGTIPSPILII